MLHLTGSEWRNDEALQKDVNVHKERRHTQLFREVDQLDSWLHFDVEKGDEPDRWGLQYAVYHVYCASAYCLFLIKRLVCEESKWLKVIISF